MIGVLVLICVASGVLLGLLGRDLVPVVAASLVAGALLVGAALIDVRRCRTQRRVIRSSVIRALAFGLVLVELPVLFGGLGRALAAPPGQGRLLWMVGLWFSIILVVVLPVMALTRVRSRRRRARVRLSGAPPPPLIWDFSRPGRVALVAGTLLAGVLALIPLSDGWPPLDLAIRAHSPGLTALSLDLGADPNRPGPSGLPPLVLAVAVEEPRVVTVLLGRGADPNDRRYAELPLSAAAAAGSEAILRALLAGGADPNLASASGFPLTVAARRGDLGLVDQLLAKGADTNLRDDSGCTALAAALKTPAVVARLLAAGASPDVYCDERNLEVPGDRVTPLMIAAARGLEPAVTRLLAAGARPALRSARGQSALDLALAYDQTPVARLLEAQEEP